MITLAPFTKEKIITSMRDWPLVAILPETKDQERVLKEANWHYRALSLWLQYRLLDRRDLYFLVTSKPYLHIKPYADLSIAGLDFCFQVFERNNADFESAVDLWGVCEYSKSKSTLSGSGYFGGKTYGKDASCKTNKKAIANFEIVAEGGEVERVKGYDPSEHWYEILLTWAFNYSQEHDDKDLDYHARRFLQAWNHFNNITRRDGKEIVRAKLPKPKRSRAKRPSVTKC